MCFYQQVGELTPMSSGRTPSSAGKAGVDSLAPLPGKFSSKSVSTKRSGMIHCCMFLLCYVAY
jgi:hypothetical protein